MMIFNCIMMVNGTWYELHIYNAYLMDIYISISTCFNVFYPVHFCKLYGWIYSS